MRKSFASHNEERMRFTGTFVRYGSKPAFRGPDTKTVLFKDVKSTCGNIWCNHLWFNLTKGFSELGALQDGDVVEFDARVAQYVKGYFGRRTDVCKIPELDYKLSHPTKISKKEH